MKTPALEVVRFSPCKTKKKIYQFSVTTHSYPYPSITFTDYSYWIKLDGKWKLKDSFSNIGHPANLTDLVVSDRVWRLAHKEYIKYIKRYLLIHHNKGTYASGSIHK